MPVSRRRTKKPPRNEKRATQPYKLVLSYAHGHPTGEGPDSIEFDEVFTNEDSARRFAISWVSAPGPRHLEQKVQMFQGGRRISTFERMPDGF